VTGSSIDPVRLEGSALTSLEPPESALPGARDTVAVQPHAIAVFQRAYAESFVLDGQCPSEGMAIKPVVQCILLAVTRSVTRSRCRLYAECNKCL